MRLRQRGGDLEVELKPGMVLGRLASCDLTLQDGSISRRHAQIEERSGKLWMVDLGSSNGIRCNGRRGKDFEIRPGDTLMLGSLRFEVLDDAGERPASETLLEDEGLPGAGREAVETGPADDSAGEEDPWSEVRAERAAAISEERLALLREMRRTGRSRLLGDLGQQPLGVQLAVLAVGLGLMVGTIFLVRWLAHALTSG